jgi:hypothetical protein
MRRWRDERIFEDDAITLADAGHTNVSQEGRASWTEGEGAKVLMAVQLTMRCLRSLCSWGSVLHEQARALDVCLAPFP